jgi:hypothetical protein
MAESVAVKPSSVRARMLEFPTEKSSSVRARTLEFPTEKSGPVRAGSSVQRSATLRKLQDRLDQKPQFLASPTKGNPSGNAFIDGIRNRALKFIEEYRTLVRESKGRPVPSKLTASIKPIKSAWMTISNAIEKNLDAFMVLSGEQTIQLKAIINDLVLLTNEVCRLREIALSNIVTEEKYMFIMESMKDVLDSIEIKMNAWREFYSLT